MIKNVEKVVACGDPRVETGVAIEKAANFCVGDEAEVRRILKNHV